MIKFAKIPLALRELDQWVLWRTVKRDKPTKVPFGINGRPAKANDPQTWSSFEAVCKRFEQGGFDGIGFEFTKADPFVGIDLDGCRSADGEISEWAKSFIKGFNTYSEVSPSQTGVKLFALGKLPFDTGRKIELKDQIPLGDKLPAVEVYEHGRYFAVTGWRLGGLPDVPQQCDEAIGALCEVLWPPETRQPASDFYSADAVVDRARKYIAKCPAAVSGQGGHNATFRTACVLVLGFQLDRQTAVALLQEWNQTCQPPWSAREIEHKIDDAFKQSGERGYLRNVSPQKWSTVKIPDYKAAPPKERRKFTTTAEAAQQYITRLKSGSTLLIPSGLPSLDAAIGGGFEAGEMVILAARPSHGKSAVALQCAHEWTANDLPVLFVTEEMSAMALGKRTLLFASETPQEYWGSSVADLEIDLHQFIKQRSDCYIVENCGTVENVTAEIERAVAELQVRSVIVDYAQLLDSHGNSRYEKITNTSIALRRVASEQKIVVLVLCQLNREIENRPKFEPKLSDLKDTGQLEQDADVIIFLVWPHRINPKRNPFSYWFYIAKNRNREIVKPVVECHFEPSRQMLSELTAKDMDNYEPAFEEYDNFNQ